MAKEKLVKEYRAVTSCILPQLSEQVNSLVGEGWQPFGSMGIARDDKCCWYCQAMVKYANE